MRSEYLSTEAALDEFLQSFRDGTLAKAEWTHGAHVAAAASYLFAADVAAVLPRLRLEIRAFNEAVGGSNTATSGYHETLTCFWLLIVNQHLRRVQPLSSLQAAQSAVALFGEARTLHTLYY